MCNEFYASLDYSMSSCFKKKDKEKKGKEKTGKEGKGEKQPERRKIAKMSTTS